jgi:hypothetical protein
MLLTNVWSRWLRHAAPSCRRQKTHRKPAHFGRSFLPRLEILEDRTVLSTVTVTNAADSGDGSLRAVIAAAQSGDQIVFDPSLQGQTITLTSGQLALTKSLDIEGPGADLLAVSGNHANRVFSISGGVTVTLAGLTITDGRAAGATGGGGILNVGSTLTLAHDVLSHNQALGAPGTIVRGGGIFNMSAATLTVTDSLFVDNQAVGATGANGVGGGIANLSSQLTVSSSTFVGNQALGGTDGGTGNGGGIAHQGAGASANVSHSTFIANQAHGGDGGVLSATRTTLGNGDGGAILAISNFATLTVESSTFTGNQAIGGNGGSGAAVPRATAVMT